MSMISTQTLRVCREGKPDSTFPDHALTMQTIAGRQNYNLNSRVIALDARASDFEVEKAIRDAIATPAAFAM